MPYSARQVLTAHGRQRGDRLRAGNWGIDRAHRVIRWATSSACRAGRRRRSATSATTCCTPSRCRR
ncbi:MAG: hypothetical protein MZW92_63665 [Comamonadaceae bacterium]|nr:hypothetical protein [Comamonadaceae bacterium]